jgi:hypothetical protein
LFRFNGLINPVAVSIELAQGGQVALEDRLGLDAILEAAQMSIERLGRLFRKRVDHPVVVPARFDQAVFLHASEMLGYLGLGAVENFLEMADAKGALGQQVQDAQARLIAQALVDLNEFHRDKYRWLTICVNTNTDTVLMKLTEFSTLIDAHPDKLMRFVLPTGKSIPAHYHITEVGHVKKDFIDCGGTTRSTSACVLQAWLAANDEDHRLEAGKLADIINLAAKILPAENVPLELEYEAPIISQFTIGSTKVAGDAIVFYLEGKHTDCLAKESCGLESGGCCGSSEESEAASTEKKGCC